MPARDDKSHSGCNNAEQFYSFTSPHDISWMVVCRHRVFPESVIGLAQLLGNADRLIDSLIPIT